MPDGKYAIYYPVSKRSGDENGSFRPIGNRGKVLYGRDAHNQKARLGSGARFRKLARSLRGKVRDPEAVAAAIGRRKFGRKRFQQLAARGRKRKK